MNAEAVEYKVCLARLVALCENHKAVGIPESEIVASNRPPPKGYYYNEVTNYFLPVWYRDLNPYPW